MGRVIIKAAQDKDLYIEWSSIVEAPTFIGTRAEILPYLRSSRDRPGNAPEARLQRADETGSSAKRDPRAPAYRGPLDGAWDDNGLIYQQMGWLPRAKLAEFAEKLAADDEDGAVALLEPFEDDDTETEPGGEA